MALNHLAVEKSCDERESEKESQRVSVRRRERERERVFVCVRACVLASERERESERAVPLYISIGTPVHLKIDDSWDSWDMS